MSFYFRSQSSSATLSINECWPACGHSSTCICRSAARRSQLLSWRPDHCHYKKWFPVWLVGGANRRRSQWNLPCQLCHLLSVLLLQSGGMTAVVNNQEQESFSRKVPQVIRDLGSLLYFTYCLTLFLHFISHCWGIS